jgi:hypothetical protein
MSQSTEAQRLGLGLEEVSADGDDFNAGKSVAQRGRKYYGKEGRVPARTFLQMQEVAPPGGTTGIRVLEPCLFVNSSTFLLERLLVGH